MIEDNVKIKRIWNGQLHQDNDRKRIKGKALRKHSLHGKTAKDNVKIKRIGKGQLHLDNDRRQC